MQLAQASPVHLRAWNTQLNQSGTLKVAALREPGGSPRGKSHGTKGQYFVLAISLVSTICRLILTHTAYSDDNNSFNH
jgi:hypothetical protein